MHVCVCVHMCSCVCVCECPCPPAGGVLCTDHMFLLLLSEHVQYSSITTII